MQYNKVQDKKRDDLLQNVVKCKVKIYKTTNMQRCPYIHEMKERLLGEQIPLETVVPAKKVQTPPPQNFSTMDQQQLLPQQQPVATVVKLNSDGYGSHTSPTHQRTDRSPLMPKEPEENYSNKNRKMYPKNAKTSLFIIMSFVYANLLIVVCIAYVISDVVTHNMPLYYYEGFFTYLYGMSIFFLLYVFCFLLQESSCCSGAEKEKKVKPPPKQKAKEKEKEKKKEEEKKKKEEKERQKKEKKEKEQKEKDKDKDKKNKKQDKREVFPRKMRDVVNGKERAESGCIQEQTAAAAQQPVAPHAPQAPPMPGGGAAPAAAPIAQVNNSCIDVESGAVVPATAKPGKCRKRKTTLNDQSHGSFFLRIGAIAFGLGTMIYNGLEFGAFFEVPVTSKCYRILAGINPVLQMIFTFMQMYFIFMNSRLNIHRFKVIARFGLMHVVATNICVWIRTLVLEYIKEITLYYRDMIDTTNPTPRLPFADTIVQHVHRNAPAVLGMDVPRPDVIIPTPPTSRIPEFTTLPTTTTVATIVTSTARAFYKRLPTLLPDTTTTTSNVFTTPKTIPTTLWRMYRTTTTPSTTTSTTTMPTTTTLRSTTSRLWKAFTTATTPTARTYPAYPTERTSTSLMPSTTTVNSAFRDFFDFRSFNNFVSNDVANVAEEPDLMEDVGNALSNSNATEYLGTLPQALRAFHNTTNSTDACGRIHIMGTIVQDSAPYLFPFIIEYSLIGAAVIYVMWKHIGRNPRYVTQEDLEHRLEVMLSRRAVAMAHAQQGRVDCVGASKGLFFGLLMLVGSLICLILFFVLVHHRDFGLLAIYLADVSHCVLMVLSIVAIAIGFCRVQSLKFKIEEQNDLNDILLRVSAFGLFTYAVFSIIAGHLNAFTKEPNLLVMVTGVVSILQVVLQLLFIADVSRRRVHLPEHDRSKPGRQVVTFLLICNVTMWIIYTFEMQKVEANPVQKEFYGFLAWSIVQRVTLPLCIFHRFHSAVALAEIWKTTYKARLE